MKLPDPKAVAVRVQPYFNTLIDLIIVCVAVKLLDWLFDSESNLAGLLLIFTLIQANRALCEVRVLREREGR